MSNAKLMEDRYMDRKGSKGYRLNTVKWDYVNCKWSILVDIDEMGQRVCFHVG